MIANDLKLFAPFRDLSGEELELLLPLLEERGLTPGRRVFSEGEDADGIVLLTHGAVKLRTAAGFEARVEAPAAFGAAALVAVGVRAMTATTEQPSTVQELSRTAFHRFADDVPRGAVRVLEAIGAELAHLLREGVDQVQGHRG